MLDILSELFQMFYVGRFFFAIVAVSTSMPPTTKATGGILIPILVTLTYALVQQCPYM